MLTLGPRWTGSTSVVPFPQVTGAFRYPHLQVCFAIFRDGGSAQPVSKYHHVHVHLVHVLLRAHVNPSEPKRPCIHFVQYPGPTRTLFVQPPPNNRSRLRESQ